MKSTDVKNSEEAFLHFNNNLLFVLKARALMMKKPSLTDLDYAILNLNSSELSDFKFFCKDNYNKWKQSIEDMLEFFNCEKYKDNLKIQEIIKIISFESWCKTLSLKVKQDILKVIDK